MADEAFALSPISARAAQPSEGDYDAIKEAFMETSRGRWFLGEYAKRNRNADTTMVLDAVSRIEQTLAAQKKPDRDPLLDQALNSLRTALGEARQTAEAALGDLALEQNLAPVRKGIRVIREIAWRLREIGADGRICDLIDSQVGAIETAAGKLEPNELATALNSAFDRIETRIAAFDDREAVAGAAPVEMPPMPAAEATPVAATEAALDTAETVQAATDTAEVAIADPVAAEMATPPAAPVEPEDAFDANDEAMLDMVAMEMSAPDDDAAYDPPDANETYEIDVSFEAPPSGRETSEIEPGEIEPEAAEAPVLATALPLVTPMQSAPAEAKLLNEIEAEPSLGSSLLANGIVSRPRTSRPDPLAPIRRMSQTEKIAFFS